MRIANYSLWATLVLAPFVMAGCKTTDKTAALSSVGESKTDSAQVKRINGVKTYGYTPRDRECLERAMFFEANRSSKDGLLAVGTVVMNRLSNDRYPNTICGVVGQKKQFAPGVLERKMNSNALPDVQATADAVLKGKRHPALKNSMFFHTAGLKYSYDNMHYVLVAGGNAFYEKRNKDGSLQNPVPNEPYNMAMIYTPHDKVMPDGDAYNVTDTNTVETQIAAVPSVETPALEAPAQLAFNTLQVPQPAFAAVDGNTTQVSDEAIDKVGAILLAQSRPESLNSHTLAHSLN